MIQADIICDICGKKRGRPNNHDLCAAKRKAKHAATKAKRLHDNGHYDNARNIAHFVKPLEYSE